MRSTLPRAPRALALAFTLALALIPNVAGAQSMGTLAGRVTSNGAPVNGAPVSASGGRSAVTHADGSYRLSLPAGRYAIRARLIGFITGTDSATITAGGTTTL